MTCCTNCTYILFQIYKTGSFVKESRDGKTKTICLSRYMQYNNIIGAKRVWKKCVESFKFFSFDKTPQHNLMKITHRKPAGRLLVWIEHGILVSNDNI